MDSSDGLDALHVGIEALEIKENEDDFVKIETSDGHVVNAPKEAMERLKVIKIAMENSGVIPVKCTREALNLFIRMPNPPIASTDPEEPDQLNTSLLNLNPEQREYVRYMLTFKSTDGIDRFKLDYLTEDTPDIQGTITLINKTKGCMPTTFSELYGFCVQYNNHDCSEFVAFVAAICYQLFSKDLPIKMKEHPDDPDYAIENPDLIEELKKILSPEELTQFLKNE